MAVNLSPVFGVAGQLFDNNGNPLAGGKIFTYLAGTTTPTQTYTSSNGTIAHSNPIILDGAGRVPSGEIWLTDGITYKFVVQDSANNLIGTYDNLSGINSNFVAFTNSQEIQTATAGQTVFNLTTMTYQPGTNNLSVFVDGVNQYGPGAQYAYAETDGDTVTFVSGLHVGASVKFTTSQLNGGAGQTAAQTAFTGFKGQVGNVQDLAGNDGADWIGFEQSGTGAVARSAQDKMREVISIADFGADPAASASVNTAAIQAAIDAAPQGGAVFIPNGTFSINNALVIDKALTIYGEGPGKWYDSLGGSIITQTDVTKNVFTLKASVAQYAFGQYGLNNVNFRDMAITGPSSASRTARGIGCDTTVNGGDYHIRECTFTNIEVRFCQTGVELVGICYLNDFYGGVISQCDTGFALYRGLASDSGGQTRFFGTTIDIITDACLRWNTDTTSGDLSLFGCTLADAAYGLIANEEATLMVSGCSFENNTKTGSLGAGIYIEIKDAINPASDAAKTIIGNKFTFNDRSIWLNKTTVAGSTNAWAWPMLIDGNTSTDAVTLSITLQAGEPPMSAQNFVLGAANAGLNGGYLSTAQISTNYAGRDMRKQTIARRTTFGPSAVGTLQLPESMVVTSARMYLTANASSFTSLFGGDGDDNNRYYTGINGQTAPLNTWTNWTPPVPQFIVNSALKQQVTLSGTAGLLGATGVFEIEGYIP